MRLADFIRRDMERILAQWEAFAATCVPASARMRPLELRDHAQQILEAIAVDLGTPQTADEQRAKSLGLAPAPARETAAQTHAVLRARSGFDIEQVASEYRALRASVLRLWMDACLPEPPFLEDVIRFNEAVDQALAESIAHFTAQVERARNLLLGMLGHDMRTPLQTIQMTAVALARLNAGEKVSESAARLIASGGQMQSLLEDLLDFSRTQLGLGINVAPHPADLGDVCSEELDQIRGAHPARRVELAVSGDCQGWWDGKRLQQAIGNLVVNALKYGMADHPVRVEVSGDASDVRLEVRSAGGVTGGTVEQLFQPLARGADERSDPADSSLGLGLYIVSEIVKAHGGRIEARSDDSETVFAVSLPRRSRAAHA